MKADIVERGPDIAGLANIALCDSPCDRSAFVPNRNMGSARARFGWFDDGMFEVGEFCYAGEFAQDVGGIAAGVTCDQNPAVTLADREARSFVAMRGTSAHRAVAGPRSTNFGDKIPQFSCGLVADESHEAFETEGSLVQDAIVKSLGSI